MTMAIAAAGEERGARIVAIDVVRGIAVAAMIVYHFVWDLWAFGLTGAPVESGLGWVALARATAATFLLLVGVNLVMATRRGFRSGPFLRRLGLIVGSAILVSIVTWIVEPKSFVFFGILHLIAAASVLALPFLLLPAWLTALAAAVVIAAPHFFASPLFNLPELWWVGFSSTPPVTVDYVPIFPWFGVVLAGIAIGKAFHASGGEATVAAWQPRDPLTRLLAFTGRWSLLIYMTHQLILFEGVALAAPFLAPGPPAPAQAAAAQADPRQAFMDECLPACRAQGRDPATCTGFCGCMFTGLYGSDLFVTPADELTSEQKDRLNALSRQCVATMTPQQ